MAPTRAAGRSTGRPCRCTTAATSRPPCALFAPVEFGDRVALTDGVDAHLLPAGHILGSSIAVLERRRRTGWRSAATSVAPAIRCCGRPQPPPAVGTLVVESTYGDRRHPAPDPDVLAGAVRRTVARGGTVLVPAFAVDRTELVLLELHRLTDRGTIPRVPVYVDSPMALAALDCLPPCRRGPRRSSRRRR